MNCSGEIKNLKFGEGFLLSAIRVLFSPFFKQFYITLLLVLCGRVLALGISYYTISNGDWNSPAVWSTNSVTGCTCTPSNQINGFNVVIRHTINVNDDIYIKSGYTLTINVNSGLSGAFNIFVENGELNSNGTIVHESMNISTNGIVILYGPITAAGNFRSDGVGIFNAEVTVNNANIENGPGAIMLFAPDCKINLLNGNLKNTGTIDFDSACIEMNDGNFENLTDGIISGTGSINVGSGNVINNGTWSSGVDWCTTGSGTGMPTVQKCVSSNCTASILPIELVFFKGTLLNDKVELTWQTVSESNNEYFTIERRVRARADGMPTRWEEIERVSGAGNSNTLRNYSLVDELSTLSSQPLTVYYRLKQTDYDGKYDYSDEVAVKFLIEVEFSVHPNPAQGKFTIELYVDEPQVIHIEIYDQLGNRVYKDELMQSPGNMRQHVDLSGYTKGVYNLQLTAAGVGTVNKTIMLQ